MNIFEAKAFLFDMDGVLVDNTRFHVLSWLELSSKYNCALTEQQVIDWMGSPGREYVKRMFGQPDMPPDKVQVYLEEKEALYRKMFAPHLVIPDGLRKLLDIAHSKDIRCAIATGGSRRNVDFVLDGLGIRDDFMCVLDASRYERGKPFPDCYLQAAAAVEVAPADCIVIEDAINGIEAARAANIPVIAKAGTNTRSVLVEAGARMVFDSFSELVSGI